MLFMSLIQWWYGDGWRRHAHQIGSRIEGTMDYFSVDLLLKTLFQPFRQISAGTVDGPLDAKMRAFADVLVSRAIGAVVRTVIILIGLITILLHIILGFLLLILWALTPVLPIIGLIVMVIGWTP